MNFGTNLLEWLQSQLIPIMSIIIIVGTLLIAWKRQFSMLIGFLVLMGIAATMVINPDLVSSLGQKIWNTVLG